MGSSCARRSVEASPAVESPQPSLKSDQADRISEPTVLSGADDWSGARPSADNTSRLSGYVPREPDSRIASATSNASPLSSLRDIGEAAKKLTIARRESLHRANETLKAEFGPKVVLAKLNSVDGRLLFVVDGLVPDHVRGHLYDCLQNDSFRRTEFARPDTREFRHHVVEYNPDKLRRTELCEAVNRLVKSLFPCGEGGQPLECYRMYTNAVSYGDAAFVHRDSNEDTHVTAIVYANPEWASELGGETLFYDEDGEIVEAVEPKPGRIVLFHGSIMHKGSPPGRLFWGMRYTTALKFQPDESAGVPGKAGKGISRRTSPPPTRAEMD